MNTKVMHIFTRTPLHVGAGSSVGAIDMPIQRERHTQIPIIPGSSLKGVLRSLWHGTGEKQVDLFGSDSSAEEHIAGTLVVGEARVTCFPVRSARGAFAWITSPLALQRYAREAGKRINVAPLSDEECLAGVDVVIKDKAAVVLEEYCFKAGALPSEAVDLLKGALPNDPVWSTLAGRLVVVSDGIFAHFCANACEVQQRIRIDPETGTVASGALFNQENVPSETLFAAVIGERKDGKIKELEEKLGLQKWTFQIGGDETIGLGYCTAAI